MESTHIDPAAVVASFTIPGEPVSKARARFTKRGSKAFSYTPERTRIAEDRVAAAFLGVTHRKGTDPDVTFGVRAHFYNGTRQRRDVDNMLKLILDGLNKIAWPDDVQVSEVFGIKSYVGKANARTEVVVYRTGTVDAPTAPCRRCGKEFRTYRSWMDDPNGKKYCSPECARLHRIERRERTCEHCGKTFHAHGESRDTRYCSRECVNARGRVVIPCVICGTEFQQYRSWVEMRPCCSPKCSAENARRKREARRSKHFPGTCAICGAGTTRKEYRRCNPCKLAGKQVPAEAAS